ncbi:Xaa-Pro aminopeptidase [Planctobacterium marinum]|uniref:Xaa-Pro aminopeptidase n=1 Tax=Planctobacterium marinum TaxID=1631968 RepID=A0AA48HG88_9ALTE|nr:Xaa-Pro aminopeptidase [Planctobacterium marinum]
MISKSELLSRRQALVAQLPANSVVILPSAQEVTRSNDTEYLFRQNSYFWYFTGFAEPDACLVLSNLEGEFQDFVFCRDSDRQAEIWQGRRLGVEQAAQTLGIAESYDISDLPEALLSLLDGSEQLYFSLGDDAEMEQMVLSTVEALRKAPKQSKKAPVAIIEPKPLMDEMRLFKSEAELEVMRKAAAISVSAHKRAMAFCTPGVMEYQLEAEIHHEFAMQGARQPAYNTIVGAGDNACILHYTENSDVIEDGELVLIDAGAELQGYAADITRTFPGSGRFSEEQELLYNIVLAAQEIAFKHIKPGNSLKAAADAAIEVITSGLVELGLLTGEVLENIAEQKHRQFYMHGLGHWLGLDVHDVGDYKRNGEDRAFEPGMVLTVEPGIYVAPDADVDARWRGIGIRIEDNILVTETGFENLTQGLPRTVDEIEQFMARS